MRARNVALGCLALPALMLFGGIVLFVVVLVMGPVDSQPTRRDLQQDLPASVRVDSTLSLPGGTPDAGGAARVLDVSLRFEEGEFEIVPGLPGESIHLDADFDAGAYALTPRYQSDLPGGDRFDLVFERTASLAGLRQLVHREGNTQNNRIRVYLPPDVPMRLEVHMQKGEAQFDLSGLSLLALSLDTRMGSTQVEMDRPNPVVMDVCDIRSEMGEMRFYGLGFAAPAALHFRGRMGGYLLDLEGPNRDRVDARFEITMGELRVEVPRELRIDVQEQHVLFGELESRGAGMRRAEGDPGGHINIEARVRFGNIILD